MPPTGGIEDRLAVLETEVEVRITGNVLRHYENLGYYIPKYTDGQGKERVKTGTFISVNVSDLPKKSSVRLTKICDKCGDLSPNQPYGNIIGKVDKEGNQLCKSCALSYVNKGLHLWETHPRIAGLLNDEKDGYENSSGSRKKVKFKCHQCSHVTKKTISSVAHGGFSCPKCSDGYSYPEKFMFSVLQQLKVEFEYQKIFDWSEAKIYDFYVDSLDLIIETHGRQHYDRGFENISRNRVSRTLEEEQENDRFKYHIAINNNVSKYIIIDCRESELEYIKNSILTSPLSKIFNMTEINWLECHRFAISSLVKEVCDLWMKGNRNALRISELMKIARVTVTRYLKQGSLLGWCDYNAKEATLTGQYNSSQIRKKKVIQINPDGEFIKEWKGCDELAKSFDVSVESFYYACQNHSITKGYRWMYKEDYESYLLGDTKMKPLKRKGTPVKKIVQLDLNLDYMKKWESLTNASATLGISLSKISSVCKSKLQNSKRKTAGGYVWLYEEDYIVLKDKIKTKEITLLKSRNIRAVVQLDKDLNFVKEWEYIKKASNALAISSGSISSASNGKLGTAGGFKWMYEEDYQRMLKENLTHEDYMSKYYPKNKVS